MNSTNSRPVKFSQVVQKVIVQHLKACTQTSKVFRLSFFRARQITIFFAPLYSINQFNHDINIPFHRTSSLAQQQPAFFKMQQISKLVEKVISLIFMYESHRNIQSRAKVYKLLLDKPYENEVTLREQNLPSKCCQPLEILTQFKKVYVDLSLEEIWGLQVRGL